MQDCLLSDMTDQFRIRSSNWRCKRENYGESKIMRTYMDMCESKTWIKLTDKKLPTTSMNENLPERITYIHTSK